MISFYKTNIQFITDHAPDPDKRRYVFAEEGPRHFLDIDHYGSMPFNNLPHKWQEAVNKYSEDTLETYGIVPWWVNVMYLRLVQAFKTKDGGKILKISADLGHYVADAHVPLHVCSNHDGQLTGQKGIHGFWESRIPELLADKNWNFFVGKAKYLDDPAEYIWQRTLESGAAADTVLRFEKQLSNSFPGDRKFAYEYRSGVVLRQYSTAYCKSYNQLLDGMIERRMRLGIYSVACFWYSAWIDAGQPDLSHFTKQQFSAEDQHEFELLNAAWKNNPIKGRREDSY
jgi:hypothetical protein